MGNKAKEIDFDAELEQHMSKLRSYIGQEVPSSHHYVRGAKPIQDESVLRFKEPRLLCVCSDDGPIFNSVDAIGVSFGWQHDATPPNVSEMGVPPALQNIYPVSDFCLIPQDYEIESFSHRAELVKKADT